jgi:hypothetical protein
MATSDKEQQSILVPQHKRLAQGCDVTKPSAAKQTKQGGLAQAKKK